MTVAYVTSEAVLKSLIHIGSTELSFTGWKTMRLFAINSGFASSLLNLVESFKELSVLSLKITLGFLIRFIC